MARPTLVISTLLLLAGVPGSLAAGPAILRYEAEAAIDDAYGWMVCGALDHADAYGKEDGKHRDLYCGQCNYEPERGNEAYVRETCFMLTYVESRDGNWELSRVETVDSEHFAVLEQARLSRETERKNRNLLAFSLLGWPVIVGATILLIALIALRTRGSSRPQHSSSHGFRLDHRHPRPAQPRNHWTVHEDE